MTIHWLLLRATALPKGDDWLGPKERGVLSGLRFPKRRSEWRLGRFTAKRALGSIEGIDALHRIQIIAAKDGAPEAFIDGQGIGSSISISHREDLAACVIGPDAQVGCDLEAVEARTASFVNDFFTERERATAAEVSDALRERQVALTWSAKESALKALRLGLRRDTRSVEVEIYELEAEKAGWRALRATISPERRSFDGWWRREGDLVLTVVGGGHGEIDEEPLGPFTR